MRNLRTVEDIFLLLFNDSTEVVLDQTDTNVVGDFHLKILFDEELTEKQGKFIVNLIKKYEKYIPAADQQTCKIILQNKIWKKPFRTLDFTKRVHVEIVNKKPVICLKMPFMLKDKFLLEFDCPSSWDAERTLRIVDAYKINVVLLNDFLLREGFVIDESFEKLLSKIEEIWNHYEDLTPYCYIENNSVKIKNANDETNYFYDLNKTNNIYDDLLLAKSMGLKLLRSDNSDDVVKMIVSSSNNQFWIRDTNKFIDLYKKINGKIAVIVSKSKESLEWIKTTIDILCKHEVKKSEIKICFRLDSSESDSLGVDFNSWIKKHSLGGKINDPKMMIFANKPPKWLFKNKTPVKIIATDSLYPIPNAVTQAWMSSHSCVIYLGNIKASQAKEKEIEQL